MSARYRGRFAPSPTGPLHFGSLVAALASFLEARTRDGLWHVRIEDLDPLRESPAAADSILHSLECHGLMWDGPVWYQSQRQSFYLEHIEHLRNRGLAYPCRCSRRELRENAGHHPRHCRENPDWSAYSPASTDGPAIRFALSDRIYGWQDGIQGPCSTRVSAEIDDFVIRRKEGFFAYQLAVVCDDIAQNITEIVRGHDLLSSTPFQLALYEAFNAPPPTFAHLPVVTSPAGQKLSKQNRAAPLDDSKPARNLHRALVFLRQQPPAELARESFNRVIDWGLNNWNLARVPAVAALGEP